MWGFLAALLSGALMSIQGVFNTEVTGPGHVWLQTMPITQFASSMSKYIVKSNG